MQPCRGLSRAVRFLPEPDTLVDCLTSRGAGASGRQWWRLRAATGREGRPLQARGLLHGACRTGRQCQDAAALRILPDFWRDPRSRRCASEVGGKPGRSRVRRTASVDRIGGIARKGYSGVTRKRQHALINTRDITGMSLFTVKYGEATAQVTRYSARTGDEGEVSEAGTLARID